MKQTVSSEPNRASLHVEIDDENKCYTVSLELYRNYKFLEEFEIPSQAVINTFTKIASLREMGYVDTLEEVETIRLVTGDRKDEEKNFR